MAERPRDFTDSARDAFESWQRMQGRGLRLANRWDGGQYKNSALRLQWAAWQACFAYVVAPAGTAPTGVPEVQARNDQPSDAAILAIASSVDMPSSTGADTLTLFARALLAACAPRGVPASQSLPASGAFPNDAPTVNPARQEAEPDEQTIDVASPAAAPAVLQTADGVMVGHAPLADGFDGSTVRPGPNHSTIEIWYDTQAQARAAHEIIRDLIDAAHTSGVLASDGGQG